MFFSLRAFETLAIGNHVMPQAPTRRHTDLARNDALEGESNYINDVFFPRTTGLPDIQSMS